MTFNLHVPQTIRKTRRIHHSEISLLATNSRRRFPTPADMNLHNMKKTCQMQPAVWTLGTPCVDKTKITGIIQPISQKTDSNSDNFVYEFQKRTDSSLEADGLTSAILYGALVTADLPLQSYPLVVMEPSPEFLKTADHEEIRAVRTARAFAAEYMAPWTDVMIICKKIGITPKTENPDNITAFTNAIRSLLPEDYRPTQKLIRLLLDLQTYDMPDDYLIEKCLTNI